MEKTTFKGRVYMTHPTKAIYKWLLADYVKVTSVAGNANDDDQQLYTEADLTRSYERIIAIDYHQEVEHSGVKFIALNAGHVLGAAMFLIEIAGVRLLYTGDYSREEDRHLMAAETPPRRPDVLVCESTYGVHSHQPRLERERRFTSLVHSIVARGGRCLIPVFALGRAQELLLILDEYWQAHPELHTIPVYYASALAKKCMSVYQTYVNMMNERIRRQIAISNPFIFKHVSNLRSMEGFSDAGPCVMMASPAMLQNGLSRELLERWCSSPRNGLIIPGYVVEGTLAKTLLTEPKEIIALSGATLPMRMSVEYISFSAHVDFTQNSEFIDLLRPPHVILVHGEQNEMQRLKAALQHRYGISPVGTAGTIAANANIMSIGGGASPDTVVAIHTPRNCESVELVYRGEKAIKLVGSLALEAKALTADHASGGPIEGVLVGKDFEYQLMAKGDLAEYAPALKEVTFMEKQAVACRAPFSLLEYLITQVYGCKAVRRTSKEGKDRPSQDEKDATSSSTFTVDEIHVENSSAPGPVTVRRQGKDMVVVEWQGNPLTDLLADALVMLIMGAESSRAAVKATKSLEHDHHQHHLEERSPSSWKEGRLTPEMQRTILRNYLESYFGPVLEGQVDGDPTFTFQLESATASGVEEHEVHILHSDLSVVCEDRNTFDRVTKVLSKILPALDPAYIL